MTHDSSHFTLFGQKFLTGMEVRSNVAVDWFFPCNAAEKCKCYSFLFRKISDSTLTQAVSSGLNSDIDSFESESSQI